MSENERDTVHDVRLDARHDVHLDTQNDVHLGAQGELFERPERDGDPVATDALLAVAGHRLPPTSDEVSARGVRRFWDWYARVSRDGQSREAMRRTESGVSAFVDRVAARLAAQGVPVRRVDTAAPRRPAAVTGPVSQVLAAAQAAHAAPLVEAGVAAGIGRELTDEVADAWVAVPDDLAAGRYVAMRVRGDSMTPLLHSNDVVLIDLNEIDTTAGSVVVARNDDGGYIVKQITANDGLAIELGSLNPVYPPLRVEATSGVILGRVVLRWCEH